MRLATTHVVTQFFSVLHPDFPKIRLSLSWLVVVPALGWIISGTYIPLFSENLPRLENLAITLTILMLMGLSLLGHVAAHVLAARGMKQTLPERTAVFLYGDAAQLWLAAAPSWQEAVGAAVGPFASLILSGLAYVLWNAQVGLFWNLVSLFLVIFNLWVFFVNVLPAFPMDGGRILRSGLQHAGYTRSSPTTAVYRFGFLVCVALIAWGMILYLQHSRFSAETAGITFALALLLLDGLIYKPNLENTAVSSAPPQRLSLLRLLSVVVLSAIMFGMFASTVLTNNGLDAPGAALSVEPMITVPPQYRHTHNGSFLLTAVFSHAPILAGEWVLSRVYQAVTILPPEDVVPQNTTIQEQARQGYQELDESEATAIAVGLRLAGYPVEISGKGVEVAAIIPQSHANGILQVGDVITAMNGHPVHITDELIQLVQAQSATAPVRLTVQRGQNQVMLGVPLLPPDASSTTPRIGIAIQSAGFEFKTPFPVSIQTQKISGGPSAGLMFTLTIYNALSSKDLTRGWKIAGTGTISLDGTVGPIGGVKQKVAAAELAGAQYFLCPVENYADAVSVARGIKVVKVANVQHALNFLNSLPPH